MMERFKKISLATKIFIAMILGSIFGFIAGPWAQNIEFIGTIWLNMIKMFIVPVVVCLMVKGIASMDNPKTLGRVGVKAIAFYMFTTVFATLLGLVVVELFKPGVGFQFQENVDVGEVSEFPGFGSFMVSLFSGNIFQSFTEASMMQVLVIAIILGVAAVFMSGDSRASVVQWFSGMADLMMSVINLSMHLAPIGVFCLMASAMGTYGLGFLGNMSKLLVTFYVGCVLQFFLIYLVLLWAITRVSPIEFLKKGSETFVTAVSTCSSAATIPVNLMVAKDKFHTDDAIANFMIPLGANMNQDGGAILSSVVMVFCAQALGMEFTIGQLFNIVILTTIVTSGSSGVPGGGIMRLMVVAAAMNLPLEIIAMVGAFYRLFDMGTTSMSVMGDLSATVIIDFLEKKKLAVKAKAN